MNYFVKIDASYICKNKAHEAAQKLAHDLNRRIVDDIGKTALIYQFKQDINKIVKAYPRCKPLPLDIRAGIDKEYKDTIIQIEGNFIVMIYQAI